VSAAVTWESTPEVDRDRWGRPLILPPEGGKAVAYTRATTLAGALEDLNNIMAWKQRMTAVGLADRSDLLLAVAAHRNDKRKLDGIVDQAREAAAAGAAATTGTALHSFAEQIDRGESPVIPGPYQADMAAYVEATRDMTAIHIEQMSVLDEFRVAGTPDRIIDLDGTLYVADIKTGSIDYPHKIALQLAIYAHSLRYDLASKQRTPWHPVRSINLDRALIIHLPAGTGVCNLVWVDIARGWDAVELAVKVKAWRAVRDLCEPFRSAEVPTLPMAPTTEQEQSRDLVKEAAAALVQAIKNAVTNEELVDLWRAAGTVWAAEHTELAALRKAELVAGRHLQAVAL